MLMKRYFIAALAMLFVPVLANAQDDVYFTPTKAQIKAEKEARQKKKEAEAEARQKQKEAEEARRLELESQPAAYYGGINKSDDEYNRRKVKRTSTQYSANDGTVYSKDSIASDVIEFTIGPSAYPSDSLRVDTVYKYIVVNDEDDYAYSRYMSRWDDFYWWHRGFGPWGYGYPLSWYAGWYGPWHSYWYDPFYDPWFYSPWYYDPWYYGSYWSGWYGWNSPMYYNSYYWSYPHYGGGYVSSGGHSYGHQRTGGAPSGTANHAGGIRNRNFLAGNGHSNTSSNNAIARRNDNKVSNVRSNTSRFGGNRNTRNDMSGYTRYGGNSSSYSTSSSPSRTYTNTSSYSGARSSGGSSSSGGGSFSGGGGRSGGGGFSSGGGGGSRSGGGGGGGHFGGGRR